MRTENIKKARVLQIQNFSVHDGDGIRSVVFFAGCPLRCKWCANPEGMTPDFKMNMVFEMSEDEIVKAIEPQMAFYRTSGGGVTFSGGEATAQRDFFCSLARRLYDMSVNLALETCGYFEFDSVSEALLLFDTIFFDIKTMDEKSHIENTGVSNQKILENFKRIVRLPAKIIVRVPVIEGFNARDEDISAIRDFVKENSPHAEIELLPYHKYGEIKYEALGLELPPQKFCVPSDETMKTLKRLVLTSDRNLI